jgi:small-conductance mechanosensitive channel
MEAWLNNDQFRRIALSIGLLAIYLILRSVSSRSVFRRALVHSFDANRILVIKRIIRLIIGLSLLIFLAIIWDVTLEGLSIYIASLITLIGVGLFATWSVVSNITAAVILFFFFPFKIGSSIKIIDGDHSVKGQVLGISLFSIRIELEDGSEVYYPNNLAIQKGIVYLKS